MLNKKEKEERKEQTNKPVEWTASHILMKGEGRLSEKHFIQAMIELGFVSPPEGDRYSGGSY